MIRFPPKKILVAYDLSDASRTAWRHAAALAAECAADLEVVYVEPWQVGVDLMPPPGLTPDGVRELRALIREHIGEGPKITIRHGDPARCVLSLARQHHPDLIVVGTRARRALGRALLGSTAEAVIRSATVPVLTARGRAGTVRSILAPVNFTPYSDYGLKYAAAVSAVLGARLKVLHVTDDPIWSGNLEHRLSALIERLPEVVRRSSRPYAEAAVGPVVAGIRAACKGQDWIVLVSHEKSLIKDVFFGTTLEQVLHSSSIPVLSVPAPRAAVHQPLAGAWA
jgi:nucleotide-binding universal stress UspA family protein